ncbi:putative minor fimbrial subunit StfE [Serratia fonticola]|nr:putative minor fimbrial subunit StfE [Serratia fonticola]
MKRVRAPELRLLERAANDRSCLNWNMFSGLSCVLAVMPLMLSAATSTVTIKVTVSAPPPCVINDDRPIEVEFGEVMTTRVDGNNYRRNVNYTLKCTNASSNAMKLQVNGTGAGFDSQVLQTNKAGLGIALLQDERRLPINTGWINFTYPNQPVLVAVPVKQSNVKLDGGEFFSAGATMKVAYQ